MAGRKNDIAPFLGADVIASPAFTVGRTTCYENYDSLAILWGTAASCCPVWTAGAEGAALGEEDVFVWVYRGFDVGEVVLVEGSFSQCVQHAFHDWFEAGEVVLLVGLNVFQIFGKKNWSGLFLLFEFLAEWLAAEDFKTGEDIDVFLRDGGVG